MFDGDQTKAYDGIHYDQNLAGASCQREPSFLRTQEKGRSGIPMTHSVYGFERGRPLWPSGIPKRFFLFLFPE